MGSGSQVFNQVRLSRTKASSLHSDIYQLPVAYFCWTTNLQITVYNVQVILVLFQAKCAQHSATVMVADKATAGLFT